jgi:hypothetical protein
MEKGRRKDLNPVSRFLNRSSFCERSESPVTEAEGDERSGIIGIGPIAVRSIVGVIGIRIVGIVIVIVVVSAIAGISAIVPVPVIRPVSMISPVPVSVPPVVDLFDEARGLFHFMRAGAGKASG